MTKDEILKEPAGPRLNAWVAEIVFGWSEAKIKQLVTNPYPYFNPSENITDAWQVVEKIGCLNLEDAGHGWYCRLHPDPLFGVVLASSAPEAICKAALMKYRHYWK